MALALSSASAKEEARATFCFGGTQRDLAMHAATAPDGAVYVVGSYSGRTDFNPATAAATAKRARHDKPASRRRMNAFLARYEADGTFTWARSLGGSGMNVARSVAVSDEGTVCVTGHFSGRIDFDPDDPPDEGDSFLTEKGRNAFAACYLPTGEFLWARCFGDEDVAPKGSKELAVEWSEGIRGSVFDADENLYLVGMFRGEIDLDPGPETRLRTSTAGSRDVFFVSLDRRGAFRWGRALGGSASDQGHAVALGPKDTLVVGGCFSGLVEFDPRPGAEGHLSRGGTDAFVVWMDRKGRFRRVSTWGGPGDDQVLGGLGVDSKGGVYACGDFSGSADFDPGVAKDVRKSEGARDAFLLRLKHDGTFDWAITLGENGLDAAHDLCLTTSDHVVVAGRFHGQVDFDPSRRKKRLRSSGSGGATDAFVASYDRRGALRWAHALGAKTSGPAKLSRATGVDNVPGGGVVVTGTFFGTIDADPGRKKLLLKSHGDTDVFVVRYDAQGGIVR